MYTPYILYLLHILHSTDSTDSTHCTYSEHCTYCTYKRYCISIYIYIHTHCGLLQPLLPIAQRGSAPMYVQLLWGWPNWLHRAGSNMSKHVWNDQTISVCLRVLSTWTHVGIYIYSNVYIYIYTHLHRYICHDSFMLPISHCLPSAISVVDQSAWNVVWCRHLRWCFILLSVFWLVRFSEGAALCAKWCPEENKMVKRSNRSQQTGQEAIGNITNIYLYLYNMNIEECTITQTHLSLYN